MKENIIQSIVQKLYYCDYDTLKAINNVVTSLLVERSHNHGRKKARNNIINPKF